MDHQKKLLRTWEFWVIFCKMTDKQPDYQIEPIIKVRTLPLFCDYYKSLPKISDLKYKPNNRISYGFFEENIKPAWEDDANKKGGIYSFVIRNPKPQDIDRIWRDLLIETARGELDLILTNKTDKTITINDKFITGVIIALKGKGSYKFEIWTNGPMPTDPAITNKFDQCIRNCVGGDYSITPNFRLHGK